MKIVLQRSLNSQVLVQNKIVGEIEGGFVLLVCLEKGDDIKTIDKAVAKILKLRVFEDDSGKMSLNILEAKAQILAVSQFTLSWDGKGGHRPSFDLSMPAQEAKILFKVFCDKLRENVCVETGRFGEHMHLKILNDGPVTLFLSF